MGFSHFVRMLALTSLFLAGVLSPAPAQDVPPSTTNETNKDTASSPWGGTNEIGLWTGYSPFSFKLKGVSEDRQLFLLNIRYARKLLVTSPLTLKYTAEIVPIALEIQPKQEYIINGKQVTNPAATIYGAGASPIGFQANLGQKRVQPFANGSVGFLYFSQQVPIVGASQFNYTITIGFGAEFLQRSGRSLTLGWKYHHLSNNYQATLNPGIDSSVFYVGVSIFRPRNR